LLTGNHPLSTLSESNIQTAAGFHMVSVRVSETGNHSDFSERPYRPPLQCPQKVDFSLEAFDSRRMQDAAKLESLWNQTLIADLVCHQ
jgi:hypothetical protein